jgi:hypothetical protein
VRQRDRHRVDREAVQEVGGAVQRVDDPGELAVLGAMLAAGLLGQDAVAGVGLEQRLDDGLLGRLVDLGDEVVGPLLPTFSTSRSSDARLMIAPAARAALMAMLSMGWSACDMGRAFWAGGGVAGERAARRDNARAMPSILPSRPIGRTHADPTRFVLVHTSHAGNVGAAARAMKVMGFSDLVLVRPRFADVLEPRRGGGDGQRRRRHPGARPRGRHAGRGAGRHAPTPAPPR